MPTKKQVIEHLLHENNFLQLSAVRIVANELKKRWLWYNIYCFHPLTIAKQLQDVIKKFTMLDCWSKKKKNEIFCKRKQILLLIWTNFLMFFCQDLS